MATTTAPNDEAYAAVKEILATGTPLTYEMIGDIFGQEFWMMIVYSFLDAQDAARAIQGAINRLKGTPKNELEEYAPTV